MQDALKILYIEDDEGLARLVQRYLSREGYEVDLAHDGDEGLAKIRATEYQVILVDYKLPGPDGLELVRKLAQEEGQPPSVMVSGVVDLKVAVEAMKLGASDFIVKELHGGYLELLAPTLKKVMNKRRLEQQKLQAEQALFEEKERAEVTLRSIGDAVITTDARGNIDFLNSVAEELTGWPLAEAGGRPLSQVFRIIGEETRQPPAADAVTRCIQEDQVIGLANHTVLISRSGREYAIRDTAAPIRDRREKIIGAVLVFNDVTEAQRLAHQVSHQAAHDPLTGLVNRREFERRLERAVDSANGHEIQHALCYLDLDQFKVVNDTAGHVAGDEMLKQVANLLSAKVRARDTLARIGGDEFSLILENCPQQKAEEIAEALVSAVQDFSFGWEGRSFRVGVSIGVALISEDTENSTQVLTQADVACYTAKDLGRNRIHVYQSEDRELNRRHSEIHRAAELREALEKQRFQLYYQPIFQVSGGNGEPVDFEILLRLVDIDGEIIMPGSFIPAAERYGMMPTIDRWVIDVAFRWYKSATGDASDKGLAINLSGSSLSDESLLVYVREKLSEFAVPSGIVCFEITETAAISHLSHAIHLIHELKKDGCRFSLDDFGSGLSSFTYLKHLPVDYLKIDGSFVRDMTNDAIDRAMVAAINEIGHTMGIQTIAEWAESDAVVQELARLGVNYVQGYLLGSPTPLGQYPAHVMKRA